MNEEKTVIADADILISLYFPDDVNNQRVRKLVDTLVNASFVVKYPNTAILEGITSLKRSLNKPEIAGLINQKLLAGEFNIIYVDESIQKMASEIFAREKSKKNTIFDAIVLATAKSLKAKAVFSFDSWYKKKKYKMVEDLF